MPIEPPTAEVEAPNQLDYSDNYTNHYTHCMAHTVVLILQTHILTHIPTHALIIITDNLERAKNVLEKTKD